MAATFFCPQCFTKVAETTEICPHCHTDIKQYLHHVPYVTRLIHALGHPESEARMSATIALAGLAPPEAVKPLLDLIAQWPSDVVQGTQAIDALMQINTKEAWQGIDTISKTHPSTVIRHVAERALSRLLEG